jgi:RNA polymerase sigma-70 factor (ECF subfamily)
VEYTDLIARARGGDEAAFETLYKNLYAPVYRFVLMRTKDKTLADDVTQETFIKFLAALPRFQGTSPLAYLHTIARTTCIDHFRKVRPTESDEELWDHASEAPSPEEESQLGAEVGELFRALATLPPAEAAVVKAKYLDGLETLEIAAFLDKSEEAVRQLVSRGLRRLRSYYDGTHD